jgi:hypothetical protein
MNVGRWAASDQGVVEPSVIPLDVVMRHVLCECTTEMTFADRDDPIETLRLNGSYEAFGIRVRVGWTGGRLDDVYASVAEALADLAAPLAVAIANQHAMRREEAFVNRQ